MICPPDSKAAKEAASVGAEVIGEEEVFEQIKKDNINFDLCICHTSSLAAMNKAGLGRILGPKGLMPSAKLGTVVDNIAKTVRNMRGGTSYRERMGVVRVAIGQLGFSPEQLKQNIVAFISQLKKDASMLDDTSKDVLEVVCLSIFPSTPNFFIPIFPPAIQMCSLLIIHEIGLELDQLARLQFEWRFQKPGFSSCPCPDGKLNYINLYK